MEDSSSNAEPEYRQRLEDSLERAREDEDLDEVARLQIDLGYCYADQLDYGRAAAIMESGLDHLKKTQQHALAIPSLFHLARLYHMLHKDERSFTLYNEAVDFAEKIDNKQALGYALAAKGMILIKERAHPNGLEFLFRGFQILEDFEHPEKKEVREWIQAVRKQLPRQTMELAIHQSRVSPKIKTLIKSL